MTKVYVIWQVDAEPWENYYDGIHKVFSSKEAAEEYLKYNKDKTFDEDEESGDYGYILLDNIYEYEVF